MSALNIETALVRRYVAALEKLKNHPSLDIRAYANEVLDALSDTPVHEIMTPLMTLPLEKLVPSEKVLRFTVESLIRDMAATQAA